MSQTLAFSCTNGLYSRIQATQTPESDHIYADAGHLEKWMIYDTGKERSDTRLGNRKTEAQVSLTMFGMCSKVRRGVSFVSLIFEFTRNG